MKDIKDCDFCLYQTLRKISKKSIAEVTGELTPEYHLVLKKLSGSRQYINIQDSSAERFFFSLKDNGIYYN